MEEWQKAFMKENLPELITVIRCDVLFLAYLTKYGAISPTEEEDLNSMQGGKFKKASALMNILKTQVGAYEHLAKALKECVQTGAFSILLKGIRQHEIVKDVLFDGVRVPLGKICSSIDPNSLQNIIASEVNDETWQQFLNSEPWKLTKETMPKKIPYYIPRTLSINREIDPEIFLNLENDIFCIEDVELHQLSGLVSKKGKRNSAKLTNQPDKSINQIHGVTTRFILLECPDHFPFITKKTEKPVHWIKYNEGIYWYVKSNPESEVKNVSKFLFSKCENKLTEEKFVERCQNGEGNEPVFIYDSPGMGKSFLLASLARKMKESRPEDSVIYFKISELIEKVHRTNESFSWAAVKQTLVENIAVNGLGRWIMRRLLDSRDHRIHLFLDGYDEVLQSESSTALKMLKNLVKESKRIRIFVATRPHRRSELEEEFGVLGYNILPFDSSNKLSFFLSYWQSEHGVKITDGINEYAEYCIKTISLKMPSDEGDIAGIPLQCRMLADMFAEEAKMGGLIPTEPQIQINSTFQVYKQFIDTKFSTYCTDEYREMCYDFHVRESLRTLFPDKFHKFHKELSVPENELIYRIGILEPQKSDPNRHDFSHRTLAEYFVGEFFATSLTSKSPKKVTQSEFVDLFFQQALQWSAYSKNASFQQPNVCRFLNFFLSPLHSQGQNFEHLKSALRESSHYKSNTLIGLLESSLE